MSASRDPRPCGPRLCEGRSPVPFAIRHERPDTGRAGSSPAAALSLIELVVAVAIFSAGLVAVAAIAQQSQVRVLKADREHLADLFAASIHTRYRYVRPGDLAREFPTPLDGADRIRRDPVVQLLTPGTTGTGPTGEPRTGQPDQPDRPGSPGSPGSPVPGRRAGGRASPGADPIRGGDARTPGSGQGPVPAQPPAMVPTVVYHHEPGRPGVGVLETTVTLDVGGSPISATATQTGYVHSRKLPTLPRLSARIAARIGRARTPAGRETLELVRELEVDPRSERARILLPLLELDARHGGVERPYRSWIGDLTYGLDLLEALRAGLAPDEIPDGVYALDWTVLGPVEGAPGGRADRSSLLVLSLRRNTTEWLLPVMRFHATDGFSLEIEGRPGLDLGQHILAIGRGLLGPVEPRETTLAWVMASGRRAYVAAPLLEASGARMSGQMELIVTTFPEDAGDSPAPETLAAATREALRAAGLLFAGPLTGGHLREAAADR